VRAPVWEDPVEENGQPGEEQAQPLGENHPFEESRLPGTDIGPSATEPNRVAGEPGGAEGDQEAQQEAALAAREREEELAAREREEELAATEQAQEPAP
jgi:hypothetical protein